MNSKYPYTVGIIGGKGGMGKLFADFFKKKGFHVLIASRSTELSVEDCAGKSDILILSVPIQSTKEVILHLAPLVKPSGVIMDLTSLKTKEVSAMTDHSHCEVIGCHPVFGPSVSDFKNQVIVLTPARGDRWLSILKPLFEEEGVFLKITTPENHDSMMAIVQGLMHFTTLTMVNTLNELGVDEKELNDYSSPVYRIRVDFANRILNQNPELYADIELRNPQTLKVLRQYQESVNTLLHIVESKNREAFIDIFRRSADYLGEGKKEAEEKTNRIIDYMSHLEEN